MAETIYNLFVYTDGKIITHLGIEQYKIVDDPTEEAMIEFLKERALNDHETAYKAAIVKPTVTLDAYQAKQRVGTAFVMFEQLFALAKAPQNPLFVATMIENGVPRVDYSHHGDGPVNLSNINGSRMIDYLFHYISEEGFDLPRLIDDDYFKAIKLLFNNRHYVSCTKLMMIFIDTMAFIEYGDVKNKNIFSDWLNTYAPLDEINITESELWEFRNGVIHMSNLHSRKVREGSVAQLVPGVNVPSSSITMPDGRKRLDLMGLVNVLGKAINNWADTYNKDFLKFEKFVERYDTIVSDARLSYEDIHST